MYTEEELVKILVESDWVELGRAMRKIVDAAVEVIAVLQSSFTEALRIVEEIIDEYSEKATEEPADRITNYHAYDSIMQLPVALRLDRIPWYTSGFQ